MRLTPHDIAKMLDHSTLQPFLTDEDIRKGCELALRYDTASVCARPCDMPLVASLLRGSDVKVCTVIGFPHGTHRTAIKIAEAKQAWRMAARNWTWSSTSASSWAETRTMYGMRSARLFKWPMKQEPW